MLGTGQQDVASACKLCLLSGVYVPGKWCVNNSTDRAVAGSVSSAGGSVPSVNSSSGNKDLREPLYTSEKFTSNFVNNLKQMVSRRDGKTATRREGFRQ